MKRRNFLQVFVGGALAAGLRPQLEAVAKMFPAASPVRGALTREMFLAGIKIIQDARVSRDTIMIMFLHPRQAEAYALIGPGDYLDRIINVGHSQDD